METMTTNSGNDINNEEHSPMLISSSSNCLLTSIHSHLNKISTPDYEQISERFLSTFTTWDDREQLIFVENLLKHMHSHQHGQINTFLLPMLQRDFIGQLAARGLEHIAEKILGYLDHQTLLSTELVCHDWYHVISAGMKKIGKGQKNHLFFRYAMEKIN
jgi:F-box and WD-40 domain protein 1/11